MTLNQKLYSQELLLVRFCRNIEWLELPERFIPGNAFNQAVRKPLLHHASAKVLHCTVWVATLDENNKTCPGKKDTITRNGIRKQKKNTAEIDLLQHQYYRYVIHNT